MIKKRIYSKKGLTDLSMGPKALGYLLLIAAFLFIIWLIVKEMSSKILS